jgi:cytochrome oxidase Cu insertion factor (SCO1/SenC/PrrC family)
MSGPIPSLYTWCVLLIASLVIGCEPHTAPATGDIISSSQVSTSQAGGACCQAAAEHCVACNDPAMLPESDPAAYRRSKWLSPAERSDERVLGLQVTDQDGTLHSLNQLCDRPTALSFIYTRCTNRNKCPRVVSEMAQIQSLLEMEELDGQVRLLTMTYDPEYDTPERLRQYGEKHGLRFTPSVLMLQPDSREKISLLDRLQVAVNFDSAGVNLHGVELFLFDRQGRFVRRYQSVFWDNEEVLDDLKRLLRETPPAEVHAAKL